MPHIQLPPLGFGTAFLEEDECVTAVTRALNVGYRHIDTAQWYRNERQVGEALTQSSVDRSEVFIATKLDPKKLAYDDVLKTVDESLERLGIDSIDLLYIHWPSHAYNPEETLPAFDKLREIGTIAEIGVCNFLIDQLDRARSVLKAPLVVHQFEHHPLFPNTQQVEYCLENDIMPVGFSPLARGEALKHPTIQEIASERGITAAQACLLWARNRSVIPIPKARDDHVRENFRAFVKSLTDQDMERIDAINETKRLANPDWAPWKSSD